MKPTHFKQQTDYTCGPACMRTILASFGIKKSERWLARFMKTNKKIGTKTNYFPKVAAFFHLEHYYKYGAKITDIINALRNGYIVIVLTFLPNFKEAHYSIVKKIDRRRVLFNDPWFGQGHRLNKKVFIKNWHDNTHRAPKTRWFFAIKKTKTAKYS